MEVASLWWWKSCRTAADEYDEGLQHTPELERSMVKTAVWQVPGTFQQLYLGITRRVVQHQ